MISGYVSMSKKSLERRWASRSALRVSMLAALITSSRCESAGRSTSVEQTGDAEYRVTGDLTIKGITKPVSVDFDYTGAAVDPFGNQRIGLEGTTTINRKDWGVNWNAALEAGGVHVSEKVTLEFEVSAVIADANAN